MQMSTEVISCLLVKDKSKLSYPSFVTFWNELIRVVVMIISFKLNVTFHDFSKEFPSESITVQVSIHELPCQINVF